MGAIVGLGFLKERCLVTLRSDSRYLVRGLQEGWAERRRANGWMRNKREKALNPDLWDQLLNQGDRHQIEYEWVQGHSGDPDNERCDQLATEAARLGDLSTDRGYQPIGSVGNG